LPNKNRASLILSVLTYLSILPQRAKEWFKVARLVWGQARIAVTASPLVPKRQIPRAPLHANRSRDLSCLRGIRTRLSQILPHPVSPPPPLLPPPPPSPPPPFLPPPLRPPPPPPPPHPRSPYARATEPPEIHMTDPPLRQLVAFGNRRIRHRSSHSPHWMFDVSSTSNEPSSAQVYRGLHRRASTPNSPRSPTKSSPTFRGFTGVG